MNIMVNVRNLKGKRIFISYAKEDTKYADSIYEFLKTKGFDPWMDKYDLKGGEIWKNTLVRVISESYFFLLIVSSKSVNKRGILQLEIKEALAKWREKLDDDIFLIPIKVDDCKIPNTLSQFQWLEFENSKFQSKLFDAIKLGFEKQNIDVKQRLRSTPIDELPKENILEFIRDNNIYSSDSNWDGTYINTGLDLVVSKLNYFVLDRDNKLLWEYAGISREECQKLKMSTNDYISKLNKDNYGGFGNWRTPTVEECLSIMIPNPQFIGRNMHPMFARLPELIETSDKSLGLKNNWSVVYYAGYCMAFLDKDLGTKAVRTVSDEESYSVVDNKSNVTSEFYLALGRLQEIGYSNYTFQFEEDFFEEFGIRKGGISISILDDKSFYKSLMSRIINLTSQIMGNLSIDTEDTRISTNIEEFAKGFLDSFFLGLLYTRGEVTDLFKEQELDIRNLIAVMFESNIEQLIFAERHAMINTISSMNLKSLTIISNILVGALIGVNFLLLEKLNDENS